MNLTLSEALEYVRRLAVDGDWKLAEDICRQLSAQVPDGVLVEVTRVWVAVLREQKRDRDAGQVVRDMLRRVPWAATPAAEPVASVLVIHGTENLGRGEVIFAGDPWEGLSFAVNGGHFDLASLMRGADLPLDRLFVDPEMSAAPFAELAGRIGRYRLVINNIADPESEPSALKRVTALLVGHPNVINRPESVQMTDRAWVAARLAGLPGLRIPLIERIDPQARDSAHGRLRASPAGLIVRPANSQTGAGMARVTCAAELDDWLERHADGPCFVIDFNDFRGVDGLYTKFRVFAIGGHLLAEHMITAPQWNVHSADRYSLMAETQALRDAEAAFLDAPEGVLGGRGIATLAAVVERLKLEYLGVDFGVMPDGDIVLFEANPAMRLNFDHCARFPYLRPHLDAVGKAFIDLVRDRL